MSGGVANVRATDLVRDVAVGLRIKAARGRARAQRELRPGEHRAFLTHAIEVDHYGSPNPAWLGAAPRRTSRTSGTRRGRLG